MGKTTTWHNHILQSIFPNFMGYFLPGDYIPLSMAKNPKLMWRTTVTASFFKHSCLIIMYIHILPAHLHIFCRFSASANKSPTSPLPWSSSVPASTATTEHITRLLFKFSNLWAACVIGKPKRGQQGFPRGGIYYTPSHVRQHLPQGGCMIDKSSARCTRQKSTHDLE